MASSASMVFCRGCGKEIHHTALTCPNCGFAQKATRNDSTSSNNFFDNLKIHTQECFRKYVKFEGRSPRQEFWYFYLAAILASIISSIIDSILGISIINIIVQIAVFLPILSAGSRRLHDTGRSGWWQALTLTVVGVFILIYWWSQEGSQEENKYGQPV